MAATASSVCCGHDDNNDATKLFAGSGVAAPSDLGTRGGNNECPMQGGGGTTSLGSAWHA